MDQGHWYRQAFEAGRKQMLKEDAWCTKGKAKCVFPSPTCAHATSADVCSAPSASTEPFPTDLDNEMLADVLRGNVKVNVHSYQVRPSYTRSPHADHLADANLLPPRSRSTLT